MIDFLSIQLFFSMAMYLIDLFDVGYVDIINPIICMISVLYSGYFICVKVRRRA